MKQTVRAALYASKCRQLIIGNAPRNRHRLNSENACYVTVSNTFIYLFTLLPSFRELTIQLTTWQRCARDHNYVMFSACFTECRIIYRRVVRVKIGRRSVNTRRYRSRIRFFRAISCKRRSQSQRKVRFLTNRCTFDSRTLYMPLEDRRPLALSVPRLSPDAAPAAAAAVDLGPFVQSLTWRCSDRPPYSATSTSASFQLRPRRGRRRPLTRSPVTVPSTCRSVGRQNRGHSAIDGE